jgi:hypothetical protein
VLHLQGIDQVTVVNSGNAVTWTSKSILQAKIDEVARELREIKLGLEELKKELSKMDFSNPFSVSFSDQKSQSPNMIIGKATRTRSFLFCDLFLNFFLGKWTVSVLNWLVCGLEFGK